MRLLVVAATDDHGSVRRNGEAEHAVGVTRQREQTVARTRVPHSGGLFRFRRGGGGVREKKAGAVGMRTHRHTQTDTHKQTQTEGAE